MRRGLMRMILCEVMMGWDGMGWDGHACYRASCGAYGVL